MDIPSGANADTGEVGSVAVEADYTVTFTAPKIGMLSGKANDCCGQLLVRDIGSPCELIEEIGKGNVRWSEPREFAKFAVPRKPAGHKGDYGHALIVAGSVGKSGAAVLASWAALRAGAGLVTVATPEPVLPHCRCAHAGNDDRTAARHRNRKHRAEQSGARLFRCAAGREARAGNGPGLSTHRETQEFVRAVVRTAQRADRARCRRIECVRRARGGAEGCARDARDHAASGRNGAAAGLSTAEVQARRMEIAEKPPPIGTAT